MGFLWISNEKSLSSEDISFLNWILNQKTYSEDLDILISEWIKSDRDGKIDKIINNK